MRRAFLEREGINDSFDEKIIPYQQRDNKVRPLSYSSLCKRTIDSLIKLLHDVLGVLF